MTIENLFDALAKYLDFLIDLIMFKGLDKYAKAGAINPDLVAFFIIGVSIAYLFSVLNKIPGYQKFFAGQAEIQTDSEAKENPKEDSKDPFNKLDMAQFVLFSIIGGCFLHWFLLLYSKIFGTPIIYSIKDTLNAVFACNAAYHPYNALASRIMQKLKPLKGLNPRISLIAGIIMMVISIIYILFFIYTVYSMAAMHDTTMMSMLWPCIVFVVVFFMVMLIIFILLGVPLRSALNISSQNPE